MSAFFITHAKAFVDDASIRKRTSTVVVFFNEKSCENHEGSCKFGKSWLFRFAYFFCYVFACNEAHKSHKIQLKNEKLSKSRGVMHLLPCILKAENTKFDTFRVGH